MRHYVLSLDQGTTSSRAIVFDREGNMVAMEQQEFRQILPAPGVVEHDPEEIWESQLRTARAALAKRPAHRRGHRRHRHCEPARDYAVVGTRDRPPGRSRGGLAEPGERAHLPTVEGSGRGAHVS